MVYFPGLCSSCCFQSVEVDVTYSHVNAFHLEKETQHSVMWNLQISLKMRIHTYFCTLKHKCCCRNFLFTQVYLWRKLLCCSFLLYTYIFVIVAVSTVCLRWMDWVMPGWPDTHTVSICLVQVAWTLFLSEWNGDKSVCYFIWLLLW